VGVKKAREKGEGDAIEKGRTKKGERKTVNRWSETYL
jgi:hypothetical protein